MPHLFYPTRKFLEAVHLPIEERRRKSTSIAIEEGFKAAAATSFLWLPVSFYLSHGNSRASQWFCRSVLPNASATSAFVLVPILFAFLNEAAQVSSHLANPYEVLQEDAKPEFPKSLSDRIGSAIFDHPFRTFGVVALPTVAVIFKMKQKENTLTLSQKLMQTRVVSQFALYVAFIGLMGGYEVRHANDKKMH